MLNLIYIKTIGIIGTNFPHRIHAVIRLGSDDGQPTADQIRFGKWINHLAKRGQQMEFGVVRLTAEDPPEVLGLNEICEIVEMRVRDHFRSCGLELPEEDDVRVGSRKVGSQKEEMSAYHDQTQPVYKSLPVLHKYRTLTRDLSQFQNCYSASEIGFGSLWCADDGNMTFNDGRCNYNLYFHAPPGEREWDGCVHYVPMGSPIPPHFYSIRAVRVEGALPNSFTQLPNK